MPEGTQKLPDLGAMKPVGQFYAKQLNLPARSFQDGFPGVTDRFEWFAVRYAGKMNASKAGTYNFHVQSDDGSIVWIDGKKVLDNDGQHAPEDANANVTLAAGAHDFQLDYFQGPRYQIALVLWVTPPGGHEQLWSTSF